MKFLKARIRIPSLSKVSTTVLLNAMGKIKTFWLDFRLRPKLLYYCRENS